MARKLIVPVTLAILAPLASSTSLLIPGCLYPALAASPTKTAGKSSSSNSMPTWRYYDLLGLQCWNRGEKRRAETHWDYAFNLCENQLREQAAKGLDPKTKRLVEEFCQHYSCLLGEYDLLPEEDYRKLDPVTLLRRRCVAKKADIDKKLKRLDRLESFAQRMLGKECRFVQDLERERNQMKLIQIKQDEMLRSMDNSLATPHLTPPEVLRDDRKTVKGPDWYLDAQRRNNYAYKDVRREAMNGSHGTTGTNTVTKKSIYNPGQSWLGGQPAKKPDKPPIPLTTEQDKRLWNNYTGHASAKPWGQTPDSHTQVKKWGDNSGNDYPDPGKREAKGQPWGTGNEPK